MLFLVNERSNRGNTEHIIWKYLEETVIAHTILTETLNVKEDLMEYAPDISKNNTADNLNDFPTDQIDVVDWNTITDDNNSVSNNILNSIPENS